LTAQKKTGVCKLTGHRGPFVKSHLIPASLTRPEYKGASLVQAGPGERPIRRWTSWYDRALVTAEGEKILAAYDDAGIKELSRHKLIWSSWGPMIELNTSDHKRYPWGMGARRLETVDVRALRMFFLSLLWRAAATNLREFSQIEIDSARLYQLKEMVLSGMAEPYDFFPMQIAQMSTRGLQHNYGPVESTKEIPAVGEHPSYEMPIFRFYLDGLAVHFDRRPTGEQQYNGPLTLGFGSELFVTTISFEDSLQRRWIEGAQANIAAHWPNFDSRPLSNL
jgi:hypothetical protein